MPWFKNFSCLPLRKPKKLEESYGFVFGIASLKTAQLFWDIVYMIPNTFSYGVWQFCMLKATYLHNPNAIAPEFVLPNPLSSLEPLNPVIDCKHAFRIRYQYHIHMFGKFACDVLMF